MALRDLRMCSGCVEKMRQIDRLKRERVQLKAQVARLKAKLGQQDRHIHEKPFGSSTSSSKEPFKACASAENQARKGGYNGLPIDRQYCYAHLRRDLEDLLKDFPEHPEVSAFVDELKPLLCGAMSLRRREPRLPQYRHKARRLRDRILEIVQRSARHPGVQSFQCIFRENAERLYQWVEDPMVPAENNTAERGLRPPQALLRGAPRRREWARSGT